MRTIEPIEIDTKIILYGEGVLSNLKELCNTFFPNQSFILFSDQRIWQATQDQRNRFLDPSVNFHTVLLPANPIPYADEELVKKISIAIQNSHAIPFAFGSGTINDVVKRAAFENNLPYLCIPTAPSVDGFTACGASISLHGLKITLECPAPLAVLADSSILRQAPLPMISAGFGDLVAKILSCVDWIIADHLGLEPIHQEIWYAVWDRACSVLPKASALRNRETMLIEELFEGLLISGLCMQRYRGSRPASGAEHLISHLWDMNNPTHNSGTRLHGLQVGLGTLLSRALMEEIFLLSTEDMEKQVRKRKGNLLEKRMSQAKGFLQHTQYYETTLEIIKSKTPSPPVLAERIGNIVEGWNVLREKCVRLLPSFYTLKTSLSEAGCPTEPAELGLSREQVRSAIIVAQLIRNRYTNIDLIAELELLDTMIERVIEGNYFHAFA